MSNPLSDVLKFFQASTLHGRFPIYALIILLIASLIIAVIALRREAEQRNAQKIYLWLARVMIGCLWYQQMLWKMPPTFTDNPDGSGGLRYWMGEMAQFAAFKRHATVVNEVILPNFNVFAFQVWATETFIAVSLILGLFSRLGGLLGMLMALNLWLGLYNRPHEWPWTYFFLILLNGFFLFFRGGRALGIDALVAPRLAPQRSFVHRLVSWVT